MTTARKIPLRLPRPTFRSWSSRLAVVLAAAAMAAGLATFGTLTATPPFGRNPDRILWLLDIDLIILMLFVMLIARRIVWLWIGRRQGLAGSRLHTRLVFIFSFLATAPAILMTIFATAFLHIGVQSWFSDRVRTAITESQAVAEAYLQEHIQVIRADSLAMANDLDHQADLFLSNPGAFAKIMQTQSMLRNLPEVAVFNSSGKVLAHGGRSVMLEMASIPADAIAGADKGEVVVITKTHEDRVRALVRLNNFPNGYLYVGRSVDPTVLSHVTDTRAAVAEYERLEAQRGGLQIKITMIFIVVALLLLLAAIWFSLIFSRKLILPISALIDAADRIRAGDMSARVPVLGKHDEFAVLGRAFNRMTGEIQGQRDELVAANLQLDERRRFIEVVLAGVSAGIVGIDTEGRITLANASAGALFGRAGEKLTGHNIEDVLPAVAPILAQAQARPGKIAQAEIPFGGAGDARKTLLVRVAIERAAEQEMGAVLTFDDITELQSAQRKAAWSDVARRIAHEIKNPLTPIQLSAERLKRKYMKQITDDAEIFAQCTDTIIEHVGDIGRMVDEFSNFARMPEPVMKMDNLSRLVADVIAFQQQAHPEILFQFAGGDVPTVAAFDARQIRQAFTNIVQNAIESIAARAPAQGHIDVVMARHPQSGDIILTVTDNGIGLPKNEDPARLTEPYVTHKEKGTGLGLAIVKKIMEDHGGRVVLGMPEWLQKLKALTPSGGGLGGGDSPRQSRLASPSDHPPTQPSPRRGEGLNADLEGATVSLILPVDVGVENAAPPIEHRRAV